MVELKNITVRYGDNVVYENFNFTFPQGINVVLGKSGCGKTTLLKTIAGLIRYDGECKKSGKVAIVFQNPCLAPVNVLQNIKLVTDADDKTIDEILVKAEIYDKKKENATRLSGGEQQRVSLARMFAANGDILLLDEPFSNLDYGTKSLLRKTFLNLVGNSDKTVVFVTHDIEDAIAVADRIYLLNGRPCQLDLFAQPSVNANSRNVFDDESNLLREKLFERLSEIK